MKHHFVFRNVFSEDETFDRVFLSSTVKLALRLKRRKKETRKRKRKRQEKGERGKREWHSASELVQNDVIQILGSAPKDVTMIYLVMRFPIPIWLQYNASIKQGKNLLKLRSQLPQITFWIRYWARGSVSNGDVGRTCHLEGCRDAYEFIHLLLTSLDRSL